MENERPKHNFLCLRRSWSRIWGLVSCLETAREKYCLACGPSSPPQHRAVAQHSLGLDSADDCLLDRVLHCRHLSTHHSNYYHLSLLAMLGIGDYGDLFAIIANFNFQLRQLVFLGNRFSLMTPTTMSFSSSASSSNSSPHSLQKLPSRSKSVDWHSGSLQVTISLKKCYQAV